MEDVIALNSIQTIAASFGASFQAEKIVDTVLEKDGCRYYKVRWVKHSWEPAASFVHLEHLVTQFWQSVNQPSSNSYNSGNNKTSMSKDGVLSHHSSVDQSKIPHKRMDQNTSSSINFPTFSNLQPAIVNNNQMHIPTSEMPSTLANEQSLLSQVTNNFTPLCAASEEILQSLQDMSIPMDETNAHSSQNGGQAEDPSKKGKKKPSVRKKKKAVPKPKGEKKTKLPKDGTPKIRKKTPGNCPICGKYFKSTTNIAAHKKLHTEERKFECEKCNKRFRRKLHLDRHLESHAGLKPYKCETCGTCFSSKWYLKAHGVIHTGTKPFACEVCDKRFNNKANLSKHKLIHENKRPYVCNICGHAYRQNYDLKRHFQTHTSEKIFPCHVCPKKFAKRIYLKRHMANHSLREAKVICNKCNMEFLLQAELDEHLKDCPKAVNNEIQDIKEINEIKDSTAIKEIELEVEINDVDVENSTKMPDTSPVILNYKDL